MRFLTVLVLIVVGVIGLGFYRGWFQVTSDGSADQPAVTVTVDKDKIDQDKQKALDKAQDLGQRPKDQAVTPEQPAKSTK